jgi:hypothetical protein
VTKGSVPEAPDGRHSSHAGTLLEAVPVALADDPPEPADGEEVVRLARDVFDVVAVVAPPPAELGVPVLEVDPVVVVPVVVDGVR